MGLTYFKRYRMELDLDRAFFTAPPCPFDYQLLPFDESLIRDHALAKFVSFRHELDVNVFPCLGRRDGCLQLMREIAKRSGFVPEATWLLRYTDPESGQQEPVGTGLGTLLLHLAAQGFRSAGLGRMHLEVTTDNTAALRLYDRLGFRRAKVVYKASEVVLA